MARRTIDIITPYLIPDQPLIELLRNLSLKGIKIRLILPGYNNHPLVAAAGRSFYEELMETGVEIYETMGVMLHAKIVIIDGHWCTVGSANMDTRSFKLNFELNVVVYSYQFAKKIEELVEDYLSLSDQKNYSSFLKRNYLTRVVEGICRAISPVF
jgi:cardiolipin synthase